MKNVLDSEGYYRTRDVSIIENDVVYVLGRAFQDGKPTFHPNPANAS